MCLLGFSLHQNMHKKGPGLEILACIVEMCYDVNHSQKWAKILVHALAYKVRCARS